MNGSGPGSVKSVSPGSTFAPGSGFTGLAGRHSARTHRARHACRRAYQPPPAAPGLSGHLLLSYHSGAPLVFRSSLNSFYYLI
ncbi:hypothetical protein A628_02443 [Salmonella enterica subsp. enterica serovar Cubana str. 76814]|uniref:Uncharacterized protein n=1 Tax=Salmonella enterica subsp. enterica serovar Cubana str. 76814 TaxID=1192560 RepID=V7INM8_SALET|nr:hypothetical protein A628_02443 [Salmonella enterica subsp. enterica serovar Cubana str. 76814]